VAEGPQLIAYGTDAPRRGEVEAFIAEAYAKRFGAQLRGFMPQLLALHGTDGRIIAAAGCRGAADRKLFLEQYTQRPIEALLRERLEVSVQRRHIVEAGSLACRDGRAALVMVRLLIRYLIGQGYAWVVFTAADTVQNLFTRLDLSPLPLCRADSNLLQDGNDEWGRYYEHAPIVMVGQLSEGVHAAARSSEISS
jgi:hypothetical protein